MYLREPKLQELIEKQGENSLKKNQVLRILAALRICRLIDYND